MKTAFKIVLLTLMATVFYAYVSHMVPQSITYPPESVELRADMTPTELVSAGQEIVGGKGTCLSCHTIGAAEAGRFPDLGGIGAAAGTRRDGYSDLDYLAESLYDPNAYIVEGFNPGMVAVSKPPVSLTDQEILAVIAYLQSLGGTVSVTMATKLKYAGESPALVASSAPAAAAPVSVDDKKGMELVTKYACVTCHNLTDPAKLLGPSLYDVGQRLTRAEIYESIMEPDATVTPGFDKGLMQATLDGVQFYDKVTVAEIKTLVDFLASRKGKE